MSTSAREFDLPRLERVVSGPDVVDTVAGELERLGVGRVIVVTGRTLGASPLLARVTAHIGARHAATFTGARQHVPASSMAALVRLVDEVHADGLLSLGGGSPIDTAKAAAHVLLGRARAAKTDPEAGFPHLAVPTTLSAGEFTAVAGITDEDARVKHAVSDPRLAPRTVLLDPTMTLETPAWLWAASGVRAIDHAVETLYSTHEHPVSEALASEGLAHLVTHLPLCGVGPPDEQLAHRGACQLASWMAVSGIANAGLGLSHALGHQIGPRWDVPHGVTSCITLPHAMRAVAGLAPRSFHGIARGLGIPFDDGHASAAALACAAQVRDVIATLGLPMRLRDVGVARDETDALASVVHDVMSHAPLVARVFSRAEIAAVLSAAY